MTPWHRSIRLVVWLAWRSVTTARKDTVLRVVVGSLTVVAILVGCALTPTALNRKDRIANAALPLLPPSARSHGVLAAQSDGYFDGQPIEVVTVASVGASARSFESIPLPKPGEIVLSPALAKLRAATSTLRERYPGTVAGEVPPRHLLGPRSLTVWRGVDAQDLPPNAGWLRMDAGGRNQDIRSEPPDELSLAYPVLALGFVLPLMALIAVLASLGGARREQRLASLRLVGLTDRAAKWSAALEEVVTSGVGIVIGSTAFGILGPILSPHLPTSGGIWPGDIELAWTEAFIMLAALPMLSVGLSLLGLRRLKTSALGVERRSVARSPGALRVVPFLLGAALLGVNHVMGSMPSVVSSAVLLIATGLLSLGLVAGLPLVVGRLGRGLRGGPLSALLASRRIESDPVKGSRIATGLTMLVVASGLMLLFFPLISESDAENYRAAGERFGSASLFGQMAPASGQAIGAERRSSWERVQAAPAVRDTLLVHAVLVSSDDRPHRYENIFVADCDQLRAVVGVPTSVCRQGLTDGSGRSILRPGNMRAVRETSRGSESRMVSTGSPFELPPRPVRSDLVALIEGIARSGAHVLVSRDAVPPDVPLHEMPLTFMVQPRDGDRLEQARTRLVDDIGASALTFSEQYRISTLSSREYRAVFWIAAGLVAAIGGIATAVAAYEHVRSSRPERRLLAVGGAPPRLSRLSILLQTMVPIGAGVALGVPVTLLVCDGFVRLAHTEKVHVSTPISGIAITAVLALVAPLVATVVAYRMENQANLLASLE
jgi:hypothetical protein